MSDTADLMRPIRLPGSMNTTGVDLWPGHVAGVFPAHSWPRDNPRSWLSRSAEGGAR